MKHIEQLNKIIETDVKFALLDDIQWALSNLEREGNIHEDLKVIATILQNIKLDVNNKHEPYLVQKNVIAENKSRWILTGEKIEDFLNKVFNLNNDNISLIVSPALKSRLFDLKWIKGREIKNATLALENYSEIPLSIETWRMIDTPILIRRALTLSMQTKNQDSFNLITTNLYNLILNTNDIDESYTSLQMVMLLNDFSFFKDNDFDSIAEKLIKNTQDEKFTQDKLYIYLHCYEIYSKIADKKILGINILFNGIENIVGETSPIFTNHSYLIQLKKILESKIPMKQRNSLNYEDLMKLLQNKISIAGKDMIDKINKNKGEKIDITDLVDSHLSLIKDLGLTESLNKLFNFQKNKVFFHTLEKFSQKDLKEPLFFSSLFNNETAYSADGRIIHNSPQRPEISDNEDLIKNYLTYRKFFWFNQLFTYHVFSSIFPAFDFIINKFKNEINENFISDLIDNSTLVPEDRKELFKLGIDYGFNFKFCEAIHILAPQLENLVREQLKSLGVSTIVYDKQTSVQNEIGLSSLMQKPEINQLFDEITIFEIKALFTENIGFNLRNNVAHGLLNDNSINRIDTFYAWLLVLRIIFRQ